MKLRICPNCDTHNALSSWSCGKCNRTLSMDTICELEDDLVDLYTPNVESGVDKDIDSSQRLLDTPRLEDLRQVAQREKEAEMAIVAAEESEKQRRELVLAAIRWKSWDEGLGTQARIVGNFTRAGSLGLDVLLELLLDEDINLRGNAIAILGSMKSPDAVEPLAEILSTADVELKKAILGILTQTIYGHGGGLGGLYTPGKVNPVWPKRRKIIIIETFINAFRDDDPSVRGIAATAIMQNMENWIRFEYDFSALIDDLIATLDHESEDLRVAAVKTLGKSKNPRVIDALRSALEDNKKGVRKAAKKSIKRLEKDLKSQ